MARGLTREEAGIISNMSEQVVALQFFTYVKIFGKYSVANKITYQNNS